MGPLKMLKREESDMDTLTDEVQMRVDHDDHVTHECTIEGRDHPPPPLVEGSYGNLFNYIYNLNHILILLKILIIL